MAHSNWEHTGLAQNLKRHRSAQKVVLNSTKVFFCYRNIQSYWSAHVRNYIYLPGILSIFTSLEECPRKVPHGMKLL